MPETFLILLAGGVMLAAGVCDPKQVTLRWLRLAGILSLCGVALAGFFAFRRDSTGIVDARYERVQAGLWVVSSLLVLGQLAFVQVARRRTQRVLAWGVFLVALLCGSNYLHEIMVARGTAVRLPPKVLAMALQTLACAGAGALTGLALMTMLLGHAYLTASQMTMAPFRRLNLALAAALGCRVLLAVPVALALQTWRPLDRLVGIYGLYIGTRWFIGLAVPAIFVYMAHDCIRRRSTQSATGILYVTGVLVFIGELVGLYLVSETGLPF